MEQGAVPPSPSLKPLFTRQEKRRGSVGSNLREYYANLTSPVKRRQRSLQQAEPAMDYLKPPPAGGRVRQQQEAQTMQKAVDERARRHNVPVPPYEFLELIGKGSFGRVFKSKSLVNGEVVAVKVAEIDETDFRGASYHDAEVQIKDFIRETQILTQLKDQRAKNINVIHEAFAFHSQLWIVSEYCPGGSVSTLIKARKDMSTGLDEKYVIPLAREIAVALKYVHDAHIIHRDIKAANILITQNGTPQLCDFGVSAVLENNISKRQTIIGTPNWMPPEMHISGGPAATVKPSYGTEVDIWAYGCTIVEIATGSPPNYGTNPKQLREVLQTAPRLPDSYPEKMRSFVAFLLALDPKDRPDAKAILEHPYVANTEKIYPTWTLQRLLIDYARWEHMGGTRASLFNPFGAAGPEELPPEREDWDDWNFSATDNFVRVSRALTSDQLEDYSANANLAANLASNNPPLEQKKKPTPRERMLQNQRVKRGEASMEKIFRQSKGPYEYSSPRAGEDDSFDFQPMPRLPFRRDEGDAADIKETVVDVHETDLDNVEPIDLDLGTLKPTHRNRYLDDIDDEGGDTEEDEGFHLNARHSRRSTRDWKFPTFQSNEDQVNRRTMDWSFPMMQAMPQVKDSDTSDTDWDHNDDVAFRLGPVARPPPKRTVTEPIGRVMSQLDAPSKSKPHPISESKFSVNDTQPAFSFDFSFDSEDTEDNQAAQSRMNRSYSALKAPAFGDDNESVHSVGSSNGDPFAYAEYLDSNSNTFYYDSDRPASSHSHSQSFPNPANRSFPASTTKKERSRTSSFSSEDLHINHFIDNHDMDLERITWESITQSSRDRTLGEEFTPRASSLEQFTSDPNWQSLGLAPPMAHKSMAGHDTFTDFESEAPEAGVGADDLNLPLNGGFQTLNLDPSPMLRPRPLTHNAAHQSASPHTPNSWQAYADLPLPEPPHPGALRDGADPELQKTELYRLLGGLRETFSVFRALQSAAAGTDYPASRVASTGTSTEAGPTSSRDIRNAGEIVNDNASRGGSTGSATLWDGSGGSGVGQVWALGGVGNRSDGSQSSYSQGLSSAAESRNRSIGPQARAVSAQANAVLDASKSFG